ncbi:uncharacterized protein LOC129966232 [Argiope bruennichi]|uniref:uncharacterized protein LOC129966232 n=1 Tax=Argiope bruennichi TaxID=94029 RepID=UPI0024942FD6|nr:uncharacterized protein LOC129966232 [Argiope bruennichi]
MLYPLVESALPEDLIKEWERTRSRVENKVKPNILGNLLEFLRSEVESDERLQLARSGFAKDQEFQRIKPKDKIPTAACINPSPELDAKILLSPRNSSTLLLTVLVKIINKDRSLIIRGLFDTGAQRSFIKKDIVDKLGLEPVDQEMLSHGLLGGSETKQKSHNVYNITLQSLCSNFRHNISVLDEKKICGAIPRVSNPNIFPILKRKNIELSDTGEATPEIDLLIGADYLGVLLTGSIEHIDKNLVAIKTKLGWTLQGKQTKQSKSLENIIYVANLDLTELWSLDAIGIRDPVEIKSRQVADEETVEFFRKTIKRNEDKRYEVCLPWKSGCPELESNKELATKRLMSTTKTLIRSGHLSEYDDVFNEWIREGIIEIVNKDKNKGHYLPHHPVIKTGDTTTKIRPVFDASAKDSKGNYIKKAFLQISLNPKDRDYFKFLWWKDFSRREELIPLRHCRVVFGASPSPFLLEATIAHHLENVSDGRKETARQLQKSFYVDNCIPSLETREEAAKFISEAKELMSTAKFDLRGWVTSAEIVEETKKRYIPILGLSWDTENDELSCNSAIKISEENITKRTLLSIAQRIYDPIGFTSPTALIPKIILQKHGKEKLIGMIDASEASYAACIFLRAEYKGKVSAQLVASKSRVSPTKEITIPRLELLGALILSRLYCQVTDGLEVNFNEVYFWTDSTVVLTWIKRDSSWNTFVRNRITEIRKYTNSDNWHFVPGHMNPADLPSRGCDAKILLKSKWWEGPEWLSKSQEYWPLNEKQIIDENSVE